MNSEYYQYVDSRKMYKDIVDNMIIKDANTVRNSLNLQYSRNDNLVYFLKDFCNKSLKSDLSNQYNMCRIYEWSVNLADLIAIHSNDNEDVVAGDIWNILKSPKPKKFKGLRSIPNIIDILSNNTLFFPSIIDFINIFKKEYNLGKEFDNDSITILVNCCSTNMNVHFYSKRNIALTIIDILLDYYNTRQNYKGISYRINIVNKKFEIDKLRKMVLNSYDMFNDRFGTIENFNYSIFDIEEDNIMINPWGPRKKRDYVDCDKGNEIKNLGSGTFGDVFLKNIDNVNFAVKEFIKFDNYLSEIVNFNGIDNDFIIKPLGYGKQCITFKPYYMDISDYFYDLHWSKKEIDYILIQSFMYQILKGLYYLHTNCIAHLDLKPDNILMGQDGYIVLADLGASMHYGVPTLISQRTFTTLIYAPPEALEGFFFKPTKISPPAVDIWSLGCVFAFMLLREPLFFQEREKILNVVNETLDIVEETGTWSTIIPIIEAGSIEDQFLNLMLQRDFKKRATVDELLHHDYIQDFADKYF